jgi:eukaryotic-like serine/threonine-protein kinase
VTEVADNTLVDGRYRILERIGSGGMADVYRAEDTHLGREVALKVLHRRFAQDAEFVERFRREASSAAGLQHPHVVSVYDRGEHEGTYYIAMEHLRGHSLKDVLASQAPLPQELAIDLGIQILQAAGFAHRAGVIHRDFKPHNVIVDENWNAKVTDFGIARAGASEMTETGSIMGTAQYLSPEQAQGHAVTAASDLYSIAVMLFEMLAGQLPFEGDSAVSVALKHLSEPPPPLSQVNPAVNPALESVVMGALAKNPAARWQSAEDFCVALEAARTHVQADGNGGQDTAVFGPVPVPLPPEADDGYDGVYEPAPEPVERKRRRWPMFTLGLMALALLGVLAFVFISDLRNRNRVDVPRVVSLQLGEARKALERAGFEEIEVERQRSLAEFDRVLSQEPDAGEQAQKDDPIKLVVSSGPGETVVPSVRNLPQERAVKDLNKARLKVNLDTEPSDTVKRGFAIRTVPREGARAERDTRVRLFISSGPEKVEVPDVTGLLRSSAESRLESAGLDVDVVEEESDQREDEVIRQSPAGGTQADRGDTVTITVSKGKEQVNVPDVKGLSASDAARMLRNAGLSAVRRERTVKDQSQDGVVIDQRPGAGTDVDRGASVVVIIGRYEQPGPQRQPTPLNPQP